MKIKIMKHNQNYIIKDNLYFTISLIVISLFNLILNHVACDDKPLVKKFNSKFHHKKILNLTEKNIMSKEMENKDLLMKENKIKSKLPNQRQQLIESNTTIISTKPPYLDSSLEKNEIKVIDKIKFSSSITLKNDEQTLLYSNITSSEESAKYFLPSKINSNINNKKVHPILRISVLKSGRTSPQLNESISTSKSKHSSFVKENQINNSISYTKLVNSNERIVALKIIENREPVIALVKESKTLSFTAKETSSQGTDLRFTKPIRANLEASSPGLTAKSTRSRDLKAEIITQVDTATEYANIGTFDQPSISAITDMALFLVDLAPKLRITSYSMCVRYAGELPCFT